MARVKIETDVYLGDYFDKFGFGDGDDGAALQVGWSSRSTAIGIVNEELKKKKLPYKCIDVDISSLHNDCRLEIQDRKGESLEVYWTDGHGFDCEDKVKLSQALHAASIRFDKALKKGTK